MKPDFKWYSFCSIHSEIDPHCHMCHAGKWINENDPEVIADHQLFKDDPEAWQRKHNCSDDKCCHWCRRYIKQLERIKSEQEVKIAQLKESLELHRLYP